ncbi:MAG: DUF4388 domain-containing protein [Trueperaceae bacterium]|nr:DUF4388 domain-containing protein [Trueperaceae bacterium]
MPAEGPHRSPEFGGARAPRPSQNISGALRTVPLSELLQVVHLSNKTGTLVLNYRDERLNSRFAFGRGRVGRVLTPFAPKFSEMLGRCGATKKQLRIFYHYLYRARPAEQAQMVAAGSVDTMLLRRALTKQVEMALLPIFHQGDGTFLFHESGLPPGFVTPGVDIAKVSLDIVRRFDKIAELGPHTLNPFDRFKVVKDVGDFTRRTGDFTVQEWRILAALFRSRTLQQIEAGLGLSWDQLLEALLLLERRGIIEQVAQQPDDPAAPLQVGDVAPAFHLEGNVQGAFSLGMMRGRRTLLVFGGAPANPYTQRYLHRLDAQLRARPDAGLDAVMVFTSSPDELYRRLGGRAFVARLLADPEGKVGALYRQRRSFAGALDVRNIPAWLSGARHALASKTSFWPVGLRMPAYFLIGPSLHIERAYYGRFAGDGLEPNDALHWSEQRGNNRYYPQS